MELPSLTSVMNKNISQLLQQALRIVATNPSLSPFVLRTISTQLKSANIRSRHEENGLHVPPFLIVSVTNRCNLKCRGCYSAAQHRSTQGEMTEDGLRTLLNEAQELGVSFVLLAGGEPLVRPEVLKVACEFRDVIFPVFTNGVLLVDDMLNDLKSSKNVIPVISLEGDREATDFRRGSGVYQSVLDRMTAMKQRNIFFGTSLTVTSRNVDKITSSDYISELIRAGCRLVFFVEYVPVDDSTEGLTLTEEQRQTLSDKVKEFRSRYPALFISFPGDEEEVGGCLAAGRGFVHISARGEVEPCPFTPWSDTSVTQGSLAQALRSPFLAAIRENHDALGETSGGCALWAKRDLVQQLLHQGEEEIGI